MMKSTDNYYDHRSIYLDGIKAVAIVAVVLYHMGISEYGYLGVDVFFVIAGYLTTKSLEKQTIGENVGGGYVRFLLKRVFRLLPLLLIASVACMAFGWHYMLPDDYENLGESVIATNLFSSNILQCITTRNYWAATNDYKPLMHTWYVGILMQFYVVYPLLLIITKKIAKQRYEGVIKYVLIAVTILSFALYLFPGANAEKFYYLPYRFYEFTMGGLLVYPGINKANKNQHIAISVMVYVAMLLLLFIPTNAISSQLRLILTVVFVCGVLLFRPKENSIMNKIVSNKYLGSIGLCSYSIFVWHQVVLALMRYSFTDQIVKLDVFSIVIGIVILLSAISYLFIERLKQSKTSYIIVVTTFLIVNSLAFTIYLKAGVVRDVPELDVYCSHVTRGMHAAYNDEGYSYDKDFLSFQKKHWLVIGDSFARDWINVVMQSPLRDSVEISYCTNARIYNKKDRFNHADVVFLSTSGVSKEYIDEIISYCVNKSNPHFFYVIGEKNFGVSNGIIYKNRYRSDYLNQTIAMENGYQEKNDRLKKEYNNCYVDMIKMVQMKDGKVRVFSDRGKFISQDCKHFTRDGARYYASLIDWNQFVDNQK